MVNRYGLQKRSGFTMRKTLNSREKRNGFTLWKKGSTNRMKVEILSPAGAWRPKWSRSLRTPETDTGLLMEGFANRRGEDAVKPAGLSLRGAVIGRNAE